jgi:GrpB-like predicted nucleotidyltransferase (UPF0157 family)
MRRSLDLVAWTPEYLDRFAALRDEAVAVLRPAVGSALLAIEHIGSTSVPGLGGKPVVDVGLALDGDRWFDALVGPLARLGWRHRGMHGDDPRRRYFVQDGADGRRLAQLHAYAVPAPAWEHHLVFRDALRADPALTAAYWAEKQRAAAVTRWDKAAYSLEKGAWIVAQLDRIAATAPRPPAR